MSDEYGVESARIKAFLTDCQNLSDEDVEVLEQEGRKWKRQYPYRWIQAAEDSAREQALVKSRDSALDEVLVALHETLPQDVWLNHEEAHEVLFREAVVLVTADLLGSLELRLLDSPYRRFWRARRPKEQPPPLGT